MQIQRLKAERELIITEVKRRLKLDVNDTEHDYLIGTYVDEVGLRIMNYCNISIIPDELSYTWVAMVASALSTEQINVLRPPVAPVEAFEVKIGDTTIKPVAAFKTAPATPTVTVIDDVLRDYQGELNAFRRLRW
jgi:Phage QLRG family, putative DNA packaging.